MDESGDLDLDLDLASREQLPPLSLVEKPNSSGHSGSGSSSNGSVDGEEKLSVLDSAAVRNMVNVMGRYAKDVLVDAKGRHELREKCSERLREEHGVNVQYAEQAVLANLDWGIDGLEKAVKAANPETRAARLEHTEKMLQVAVLLDPKRTTAGVPNSYLSAWASYYMALVWKLRNSDRNAALYLLDVFLLEPSHARKSFVPPLWEQLFRPHMANIEAWYRGELEQIMNDSPPLSSVSMFPIPKPQKQRTQSMDSATSHSHSRSLSKGSPEDFRDASNFSSPTNGESSAPELEHQQEGGYETSPRRKPLSLAPDQVMRMELLNKLYQDSLDENTKQYAQYYKDWMAYEDADDGPAAGDNEPRFPRIINPSLTSPFTRVDEESTDLAASSEPSPSPLDPLLSPSPSVADALKQVAGDVGGSQNSVARPRQPSFDRENDSFTFSQALVVSPTVGALPLIYGVTNGHEVGADHSRFEFDGSFKDDTVRADQEDDATSATEVDKVSGVYLDGEPLTEDELLSVWEEISEGRIDIQEAREFVSQLADKEGQSLDFKKLSEFADAVRARREDQPESRQAENSTSPEPESIHSVVPSVQSHIEEEEEESEVRIGQEFERPDKPVVARHSSRNYSQQMHLYSREQALMRPPKDFVCPITSQLFQDPVTLETGQTYERAAIQKWFNQGNTSCPITRQKLKSSKLPNTNYVLKRLVDHWKEEHPEYFGESTGGEAVSQSSSGRFSGTDSFELEVYSGALSSGTRSTRANTLHGENQLSGRWIEQKVTLPLLMGDEASAAHLETMLRQLRSAVDTLLRTDDLAQCERAALLAAHVWMESKFDETIAATLSKAVVVESLMEVFFSSSKDEVLRSIVSLVSDLISKDEFTRHTVLRTDPELESIVSVLKSARVPEVAVLLHLLKAPASQMSALKVVPYLVSVVQQGQFSSEGTFSISISPKAAAVYILEQLVTTLDHRANMGNAEAIVKAKGVPCLMERLESKSLEEKISAVAVLWSCLQSDGSCRMLMVQNLKMANLVDLLHNNKEQARTVAIFFLAELIRLNRRRIIEQVLVDVVQEGVLNSMHILMLHLQVSPLEHRPLVAGLLLQLDVLADPQKYSIYREEALEALVNALNAENNAKVQSEAAKALASLCGRYSNKGKSATEAILLKLAGFKTDNTEPQNSDLWQSNVEVGQGGQEDKMAADEWDKRMATAVLGSGRPLIEAMGVALTSKSSKIVRSSLVATGWLTGALRQMPNPGVLSLARNCILPSLVSILQTAREAEFRVLACLSLHNLIDESGGVLALTSFAKDLVGPLRRLRNHTWIARKLLEAFAAHPSLELNMETWEHGEMAQLDVRDSGETRALCYLKGYLYSGHTDATIKTWAVTGRSSHVLQEVREHSLAVLCLTGWEIESKLFSGSADKTVRVWSVEDEEMRCIQVIDVKETVHSVATNSSFICVIPQGVGLKVLDARGSQRRLLISQKHVQSIAFGDNNLLYCGCTDNSILEVDLENGATVPVQSSVRSMRGKKAVYSMAILNNKLVAGGAIVEGIAVKIWEISSRSLLATIATQIDVRVLAVSEDLVYLASNFPTGTVEVWLLEKNQKVASFSVGSKIFSFALVGETLYAGCADGILRAWTLV